MEIHELVNERELDALRKLREELEAAEEAMHLEDENPKAERRASRVSCAEYARLLASA